MISDSHIAKAEELFKKALGHLKSEFAKLQVGRASAALVEGILVEAYGTKQPLKAVASISVPDPKSLQIQPWDRSQLAAIEKGIIAADMGVTPVNDGLSIRLNFPQLTEERRVEMSKVVHKMAEEAKISIRQARADAHASFRELEKEKSMTEDEVHGAEKKLQERVDHYNKEVEEMAKKKEADVMTV